MDKLCIFQSKLLIRYPHKVEFFIANTIYSRFNKKRMSWDETKVNLLKEFWKAGYTASQIAAKIGNVSRNAVIGKAHRLNLQTRAISKKSKIKKDNNQEANSKKRNLMGRRGRFKAMLLDKSFPPEQPTKLLDLTDNHCKWPLGEKMKPATFFCGRKPVESKNLGKKIPYCELHLLYGYVSKSDKEEDQITEEDLPQFIEKKVKIKSA